MAAPGHVCQFLNKAGERYFFKLIAPEKVKCVIQKTFLGKFAVISQEQVKLLDKFSLACFPC